jgi:hypothetical protein
MKNQRSDTTNRRRRDMPPIIEVPRRKSNGDYLHATSRPRDLISRFRAAEEVQRRLPLRYPLLQTAALGVQSIILHADARTRPSFC